VTQRKARTKCFDPAPALDDIDAAFTGFDWRDARRTPGMSR